MNRPYSHPSALDRAVLHTINQAILLTSVDGVIVQFNHAAEKMFGFRADEVVGKITPVAFYDPLSLSDQASRLSSELGYLVKAGFEVLVAQARLGATTESEWSFTRKDGSRFPGHSSVTALRDQGGEIIGFLAVVDDISEKRRVDAVTRELIAQRSDSLAELQRRAEELVALNELNDMLRSCSNPAEAYNVIRASLLKLLPETSGSLAVFRRSEGLLDTVSLWGEETDSTFAPEECWALRRSRLHTVDARRGAAVCLHINKGAGGYTCAPMSGGGETLGILHVRQNSSDPVPEERQRLVQAVAGQVGLILANLRLQATLRSQSIRDSLTGVFNRGYLEETMVRELKRAKRESALVGVLMLDVDHFKQFNDSFGHEAGDIVLREVGRLLREKVRGADVPCRYGGEEFAVVFPGVTLDTLMLRAEQIRVGVRTLRLSHAGRALGVVTVSIGITIVSAGDFSGSSAISRADAALYQAKKEGRDRVIAAPVETPHPHPLTEAPQALPADIARELDESLIVALPPGEA